MAQLKHLFENLTTMTAEVLANLPVLARFFFFQSHRNRLVPIPVESKRRRSKA